MSSQTLTQGPATRDELLRLPAAIDLDTANRAFALGRSAGYALAKRGTYPCRVLKLGNAYRVVTADMLNVLGIAPSVERCAPDLAA